MSLTQECRQKQSSVVSLQERVWIYFGLLFSIVMYWNCWVYVTGFKSDGLFSGLPCLQSCSICKKWRCLHGSKTIPWCKKEAYYLHALIVFDTFTQFSFCFCNNEILSWFILAEESESCKPGTTKSKIKSCNRLSLFGITATQGTHYEVIIVCESSCIHLPRGLCLF